uniref:Uncharacterized protein n=1 Tax=Arundo donax TaxID=35708 RepID=A0A0A8YM30_ARUDO
MLQLQMQLYIFDCASEFLIFLHNVRYADNI